VQVSRAPPIISVRGLSGVSAGYWSHVAGQWAWRQLVKGTWPAATGSNRPFSPPCDDAVREAECW